MSKKLRPSRLFNIFTISFVVLILLALLMISPDSFSFAASLPNSIGYVNSSDGVTVRKNATTSSDKIAGLGDNTKVTIKRKVFTSKTGTADKKCWYYVTANGKTGYIRADLLDNIKYASATGKTTSAVNYRVGPGTKMSRKGTFSKNKTVTVQMAAKQKGVNEIWYRILINGKPYYISGKYLKITSTGKVPQEVTAEASSSDASQNDSSTTGSDDISDVARALKANATNGGSCRIVYTFDTSNSSKKWKNGIVGYGTAKVPQGMAFNGNDYCFMFAMNNTSQALVRYNAKGTRISNIPFNKNRGHLNGLTWNAKTGKFYIFKGNQTTIYTYDPTANAFGTATTPYSSSGIGYDPVQDLMYASSKTGIREYSSDGKFSHKKLFNRCTYSGTTYIQDCCAYDGFVFHCISGSSKSSLNYIDVYRTSDGKYMGTIQTKMGEIESCAVNASGYLEFLSNTPGTPDYVWVTPLKVSELK